MEKYNEKLIKDYVLGNDIDNYDIDELENDFEFMYHVLKYTMDKEMFNFCSDELKYDVKFVREVIELFKNDKQFVLNIVNKYIENLENTNQVVLEENVIYHNEILVLTNEITKTEPFEDRVKINLDKETIYNKDMFVINAINENPKKFGLSDDIGLGFVYILTKYNNSEIMNRFYAKKITDELFYNNEKYSFEELMHLNTTNKESLNKEGVNKYILDYIYMYDKTLGDYLANNIDLLANIRQSISTVYNNWDKYIENLNSRRALIIAQELENFVSENKIKVTYSLYDMIDEIMFELGYSENRANDIETIQSILHQRGKNISFTDNKLINFITLLIKELYSKDAINTSANFDKIKEKCENGKILVLDNYKKQK